MAKYKVWKKFVSRKFLFALLSPVVALVFDTLGLPLVLTKWAIGALGGYILVEGAADVVRANGKNGKVNNSED